MLEAFKSLVPKPNAKLSHKIKDLEDVDQIVRLKSGNAQKMQIGA